MYKIVKAECLADKIYLMDVEAPRVARACQPPLPIHELLLNLPMQ